ncbi:MAG TPA: lamin tail domain-containing protein, partial [Clostridia bacterium]|nr:lamin tail domain-containing protein [Clostridia bacterium]
MKTSVGRYAVSFFGSLARTIRRSYKHTQTGVSQPPIAKLRSLSAGILVCCTSAALAQTNGVLREVFTGISGGGVSDLTSSPNYPDKPDAAFVESAFEAPSNFADNYGQRMRALLIPPVTGSYVFYIASDDGSALFLSTNENPANKRQIASESSWTNPRQYNLHASQKSSPIPLTKGVKYYIEALQKEGTGGDNLAVTWQKPGEPAPTDGAEPISGVYLVPYGLGPPVISAHPTNVTVIEGGSALFTVQLAQMLGATFQWQRNSVAIPGATNSSYFISPVTLSDSGSKFSCLIVNYYGSTNSAVATLTINPDVTKPALISAANLGDPQILTVIFSEPVEGASATKTANYTLDNGVSVISAAFGPDARTIILNTTPMQSRTSYTLTVNNVRDRATTPNVILPNSQLVFTTDATPLDLALLMPSAEPMGPSTRRGPVIISEIMYHPLARADGKNLEYVELYNSQPFFEDLSGYRLTGDIEFTFPTNTVLPGRGYLVIAGALADFQRVHGIANVVGSFTNKLANGGGTLRLSNREGGIVFEVSYSSAPPWPAAADGAGHSLVLARPSLGQQDPAAWAASVLLEGSPGRAETTMSNPYRTVLINEFLAHTDPPDLDYIELYNYSSTAVDLSGCVLTDDPTTNKYIFPTNSIISGQGFLSVNEAELGFRLDAAGETIYFKDRGNTRVLEAVLFGAQENGVSTGRTPDGAPDFSRLQTKTPGLPNSKQRISDVVINEIMYDPVSGDSNDQYVELFNRSSAAVDVSRWSFEDGIQYTIPV